MKPRLTLLAVPVAIWMMTSLAVVAQESIPVSSFERIVASPRVNVILEAGDKESVRILYNQIPKKKVNVVVKGKTLKIYLDHAKMVEKQVKVYHDGHKSSQGIYAGSSITAYITYRELKAVQMRGEEELRCDTSINGEKFKLKAYGETEINLANVDAKRFKVVLYGQNDFKLRSGHIEKTKYKLYGSNYIDASGAEVETIASRIFGEGKMRIKASDTFNLTAFGEPTIQLLGSAHVHRGIVLGRVHVQE